VYKSIIPITDAKYKILIDLPNQNNFKNSNQNNRDAEMFSPIVGLVCRFLELICSKYNVNFQ